MRIYIGTDHAGYVLKEKLVSVLKIQGHEVIDEGAYSYNEGDDYPDFCSKVARAVSSDIHDSTRVRGIILGGSGEGEAITANRFPYVRAVVYYGKSTPVVEDESGILARSRAHNDANVLSLGARYFTEESMMEVVNYWLGAKFSGDERHVRRLKKIDDLKIDSK
ncbi:MAG: RpiB/LacA/LacB family sugar-phosphate isomerase [Candidatus Paceibacterota bacterium]|jgi:ribose 5-phosphate isomerase B